VRYIDVCSGISAPTMAWKPLGWKPLCFAEIEAAPRSVLAHHYPDVPLNGDFTQIKGEEYGPVDLLVGGTPCQSFSVAGLRGGLGDDRGNLALEYLRLADRARPRWLVWENVPGVLSSNGGRDFGAILGGMVELGYGVAYRVLDAQHFGVPQRRRRVFVVGHLGDWRRAAAVLFERHSLSGDTPPRREKGPSVAALTANGVGTCGADDNQGQAGHLIEVGAARLGVTSQTGEAGAPHLPTSSTGDISHCLNAGGMGRQDYETETLIAHSLRGEGFDASEDGTGRGTPLVPVIDPFVIMERGREGGSNLEYRQDGTANAILTPNGGRGGMGVGAVAFAQNASEDGTGHGTPLVPVTFAWQQGGSMGMATGDDVSIGLIKSQSPTVAFSENQQGQVWEHDSVQALNKGGGKPGQGYAAIRQSSAVRRLTPRECERLQGFPDDFTLVPHRGKPMADGPRYKMLGNSMAVPVISWIGRRIAMVEAMQIESLAA
jgi:DNA (cytosine-5)-methyltransferase 1